MSRLLVLSAEDVRKVLTIKDALDAVEDAYGQKTTGEASAWPMVYEQFVPGESDMDIRSGELKGAGLFGLKLTAWFSGNPSQGQPEIYGTTLLCDDRDGRPLALVNASAVTGLRTGAAGALGVKHLARKDARRLLVCGCGHQSSFQVAAALAACPQIGCVQMWDPTSAEAPVARVAQVAREAKALLAAAGLTSDATIEAVADGEAAVRVADAIVTITPATTPFVQADWVRPGTHLSCVGADMEGKQEVQSALAARARLFCDDRAQSVASGELEVPCKEGVIASADIVAELGEVIVGRAQGRTSDDEVTLFDTSGIAAQDLAASKMAYDRAVELGLGTTVEL